MLAEACPASSGAPLLHVHEPSPTCTLSGCPPCAGADDGAAGGAHSAAAAGARCSSGSQEGDQRGSSHLFGAGCLRPLWRGARARHGRRQRCRGWRRGAPARGKRPAGSSAGGAFASTSRPAAHTVFRGTAASKPQPRSAPRPAQSARQMRERTAGLLRQASAARGEAETVAKAMVDRLHKLQSTRSTNSKRK